MSDLISRSRLIEEIKENQWGWFSREMLLLILENQPSVTDTNVGDKWIPIGQYPAEPSLLCFEDGTMCVGYFDYDIDEWEVSCGSDIYFDDEPVAWMPLPEPYKGE